MSPSPRCHDATAATVPSSEDIQARYDRSSRLTKRVYDVYKENKIAPHWLAKVEGGATTATASESKFDAFWYRKQLSQAERFEFILVELETGERRRLFDHGACIEALRGQGVKIEEEEEDRDDVSFPSIDLGEWQGGSNVIVRFRLEGKKWEFCDRDGTLKEYDGAIEEEGEAKPLEKERPSEDTSGLETAIIFMNTKGAIDLFWVDAQGKARFYANVESGGSSRRPTYEGHVWRVVKEETKDLIACYVATEQESKVVIEEGMLHLTKDMDEDEKKKVQQPSAKHVIFVKDHNVWIRDDEDKETQLSTSGSEENPFDDDKIYPSVDHGFVVVYQYTREQDHTVSVVKSSPKDQIQPRLKQFQYLKAGDTIRIDKPKMFNLITKQEISFEDTSFQTPFAIKDIGWSLNGKEYRFLYNQRGHQIYRLIGIDTEGKVRTIIEETSQTFIDYSGKLFYHEIKESDEMVWASERDGWNHLYLFDLKEGRLKNQVTKGEWVVRSVEGFDEEKRVIWVKAFGLVKDQDPYYAQLVRVNFDGSGLTILTEGDGSHSWKWSPDHRWLVDTWSRVDQPPRTVLRDGETGKQLGFLEEDSLESLHGTGLTTPERFVAPGRDGKTMIYGIIIRPSDLDENKKYPVIENIYAGPQDFEVPKSFSTLLKLHELAELGFVVVRIDGMGTNWRSKAFHDICYKNLKDAGLPDRIAWMTTAARSRPWMDLDKVGIYGGSAGGQNALSALLWHGDFYKVGVSDCGCHDNRMDKLWWNEQWMGWPVDQSYEESSNVVHAHKLTGALMLIVGELDTNVDPASTMQVVNQLNEAEKDYDLLFIPGAGHGVGSSSRYAIRRQKDFFVRHLLGVESPRRNEETRSS